MRAKRLFGTRGIRGPITTKITPELALKLGLALASQIGGGEVVVARDSRTSGGMLVTPSQLAYCLEVQTS